MNRLDTLDFRADARISSQGVAACTLLAGCLLTLIGDSARARAELLVIGLILIAAGSAGLYLVARESRLAPWMTILGLTGAILAGSNWLGLPSLLFFLVFPIIIAAAFVGLRAALSLAGLDTALLLALAGFTAFGVSRLVAWQALASIWLALALMAAVYAPIYQLLAWLWGYFQLSQAELKEARDQRAQSLQVLDELAHANRQLTLANERMASLRALAEEAQQSKASFVAKVSHEFRTPLNIIVGLTTMLLEDSQADGGEPGSMLLDDLKVIGRNCEHLSALVNDVLDLSRAEAGHLTLQKEWIELDGIITDATKLVRPLVDKKHLALEIAVPPDLPLVYCDRTRIRQVVLNLVSNAARFTDAGKILIRAQRQNGSVQVHVSDTGPGVRPEDRERIFEPFCQGSGDPWRERGGSGLGLSISKQFIELHQGRMWLESEVGAGTTFSFELPISPRPEPVESPARWIDAEWLWHERTDRPALPAPSLDRRLVMLDEAGSLYPALRPAGQNVELVQTRQLDQLAAALQESPAHVVLVNSATPQALWAAIEQVRPVAPDTPLVACCVPPSELQRAREGGVISYLAKPVTREKLAETVQGAAGPLRRVLVVDDDADTRWLLRRTLSAGGDLEVDVAADGEEALRQMKVWRPDLVLLDIFMPGVDGWEVLRRKAADPALRSIPVILISGQDALAPAATSAGMLVTMGDGLSMGKLLRLSLECSALLLSTD